MALGISLSLSAVGPGEAYLSFHSLFGKQDSRVYLPGLWEQLGLMVDPLKTQHTQHTASRAGLRGPSRP